MFLFQVQTRVFLVNYPSRGRNMCDGLAGAGVAGVRAGAGGGGVWRVARGWALAPAATGARDAEAGGDDGHSRGRAAPAAEAAAAQPHGRPAFGARRHVASGRRAGPPRRLAAARLVTLFSSTCPCK